MYPDLYPDHDLDLYPDPVSGSGIRIRIHVLCIWYFLWIRIHFFMYQGFEVEYWSEFRILIRILNTVPDLNTDPDFKQGSGFWIRIRIPNTDLDGSIEYGSGQIRIHNTACRCTVACVWSKDDNIFICIYGKFLYYSPFCKSLIFKDILGQKSFFELGIYVFFFKKSLKCPMLDVVFVMSN